MGLTFFQADAFTDTRFKGNPAAICLLENYLPDGDLQNIANEMNLSETAFIVASKTDDADFELRWFTPLTEVRLCGHATLAAAHIVFSEFAWKKNKIKFKTRRAGILDIEKIDDGYRMNFPLDTPKACKKENFKSLVNKNIIDAYSGEDDLLLIFESEDDVRDCIPDIQKMKAVPHRLVIVSAAGENADFVSRVFGPSVGIEEDPVTGSAHTLLAPFWSKRLDKKKLRAVQLSKRRGDLLCELDGDRVYISGSAVTVLKGEFL